MKQKNFLKIALFMLFAISTTFSLKAQTLTAGDIAIIGVSVDDEEILLVALADIPAGESVFFTDDEWGGSAFNTGEGFYEWVTPLISAGTTFTLTTSSTTVGGTITNRAGNMALSNSGDGFFLYQTSTNTFNTGTYTILGFAGEDSGDAGTLTGTGLTEGTNAVYFGGDNGIYTGVRTSNDKSGHLTNIYNSSNWATSGSSQTFDTSIFIMSGGAPSIGFDNATSSETETNTSFEVLIPVTVSNYGSDQIDVSVAVTGGTAEVADYTLNTTSLSFTSDGSKNVSLDINPDLDDFDDETIILTLTETSSVTGLIISQSTHTVTVTDDETPPSIGFDSATSAETETDATFTSANIPITVSNYSGTQIDINVSVTGGTAEVEDYTFTSPTALSFTADETQNITISINDDADTDNETIIFTIIETSSVTGLVISEATHTLTITDDETPPLPTAGNVFITEVVDADNFNYDYLELFNNSNETVSLNTSKLVRVNASDNSSEYVFDFGTDETTANVDVTIPAYGFLIITRGGTRADFNTDFSITLNPSVAYNGGNTNLFFGNGRRWRLRVGGTANTDDGTLIDDTGAGVGSDKDYRNIFTDNFISGTLADATPGELEYLVYNGGTWVNSVAMDATTASQDAYIYDDLVLSSNAEINDLGIASGGSLTINSGIALKVNGNSTGNVTYNRELTFVSGDANGWHLVASPVTGQSYDNAYANTNSLATSTSDASRRGLGIAYDTASNGWTYLLSDDSNSGTFMAGSGYSMKRSSTGDVSFTGTLNTNDVNGVSVSSDSNGFNLLGNPYTSFMSSQTFLGDNTNTTGEIWTWTHGGGYTARAAIQNFVVAPAQAFFVSVNTGSTINFAKSNQATSGDTFQKSLSREIKLMISDGNNSRFAQVLYFDNNATTSYDWGYEARLFGGVSHSFAIYSDLVESDGKKYQVQSLPNSDFENMVVPIGVIATSGKEITFTAEALNLPSGIKVFLEDKLTNTFTRLDEANSDYKVTLSENINGIGRFYLHTKSSALSVDDVTMDGISIYKTNNATLRITGLQQGKANVSIYNMLGKQVLSTSFTSNGVSDVALPKLATGIYIVQLATETGTVNKKITLE
jgi:hypothetical protein